MAAVTLGDIQQTLIDIRDRLSSLGQGVDAAQTCARQHQERVKREPTQTQTAAASRGFEQFAQTLTQTIASRLWKRLRLITEWEAKRGRANGYPSRRLQMTYHEMPDGYPVALVLATFHNSLSQWAVELRPDLAVNQFAHTVADAEFGSHVLIEGPCADYYCRITMMGR